MNPQQAINLIYSHYQAGRIGDVHVLCLQLLKDWPEFPPALHFLGLVEHRAGNFNSAISYLQRSIAADPSVADTHVNLGVVLGAIGKLPQAAECFTRAIQLQPNSAAALAYRGSALVNMGKASEAVTVCRRAMELNPSADSHNGLGNALRANGDFSAARAEYERALQLHPNMIEARTNLGCLASAQGDFTRAIQIFRAIIATNPDYAPAHWELAVALLILGDFSGWSEFQWRLRLRKTPSPFPGPAWDGGDLQDQRIVLHAEQGFGDAIQFIRYAPLVAARGGIVLVMCHPPLKRLLSQAGGVADTYAFDEKPPPFDVHCPLMDLPAIFKSDLASIPATVPYLAQDATLVDQWRQRMDASAGNQLKIGVCWAGRRTHPNDRNRSVDPALLSPLLSARAATFYSLQNGQAAPPEMGFIDLSEHNHDFADAAAMVANLDLAITVDTAMAHLAGALGKPVWVLLSHPPDWRWMLDRQDSPWYPTLRLFRQPASGDWQTPISKVAEALRTL